MKIALLFSGQIRELPKNIFRFSLLNLTKNLDYEIYAYFWDEVGKSLNHSTKEQNITNQKNGTSIFKDLFEDFKIRDFKSESYLNFKKDLHPIYKNILESKAYHYGTINSLPQIYCISKCYELMSKNGNEYDLIFRCRFDTMFVHPLEIYDLEKLKKTNNVYNINFGRSFYPKRIYDIFFGGSSNSMIFLKDIWQKIPLFINDEFDNRLDKRDACRILYIAALKKGSGIDSFDTRICDVFRNFKNNYYEKYLIKMHLISIKKSHEKIKALKYFFKWFKLRKFKIHLLIFFILKKLIILPLAYIKRSKYFWLIKIKEFSKN